MSLPRSTLTISNFKVFQKRLSVVKKVKTLFSHNLVSNIYFYSTKNKFPFIPFKFMSPNFKMQFQIPNASSFNVIFVILLFLFFPYVNAMMKMSTSLIYFSNTSSHWTFLKQFTIKLHVFCLMFFNSGFVLWKCLI